MSQEFLQSFYFILHVGFGDFSTHTFRKITVTNMHINSRIEDFQNNMSFI